MVDFRLYKKNPCVIRCYRDKFVDTPYLVLIFDRSYDNYYTPSQFVELWSYTAQYLFEF